LLEREEERGRGSFLFVFDPEQEYYFIFIFMGVICEEAWNHAAWILRRCGDQRRDQVVVIDWDFLVLFVY
jgi:hypothetical protein